MRAARPRYHVLSLSLALGTIALSACQGNKKTDAENTIATQDGNSANPNGDLATNGNAVVGESVSADAVFTGPVPTPVCATNGNVDINVVVTSKKGPKGAAEPVFVSNALYSVGIDDLTTSDYMPTIDTKFLAYLKALTPGYLRFPAGVRGQRYRWQDSSADYDMTPAMMDAFMSLVKAANSNAYLAVNIETGTTDDASAMITYVNKTKNYGVKWWQIGNEPTLYGEYPEYTSNRQNPNVAAYNSKYMTYRNLLKSIDPSVKTVGIVSHTGVCVGPTATDNGEGDWLTPFLAGVKNQVDAIAWHWYPLYSGDGAGSGTDTSNVTYLSVANLFQEVGQNNSSTWPPAGIAYADVIMPYMKQKIAAVAPNAEIWIDEYAEDSGNNAAGRGVADKMAGALWAADSMGRYADQGVGSIHHFIYKAVHEGSGIDFGYTLLDPNNNPRPEYYALWLMANHYGDHMVDTSTSAITQVSSHAAVRGLDGSLRVMLVNKSSSAKAVRLKLADFAPVRAAQWTLSGSSMTSTDASVNGVQLTADAANKGQTAIASATAQACQDNIVTVPPISVSILLFTAK